MILQAYMLVNMGDNKFLTAELLIANMRINRYIASFTAKIFINLAGSNGLVLNVLLESIITTSRFVARPPKIMIVGNISSSNKLNLTFSDIK